MRVTRQNFQQAIAKLRKLTSDHEVQFISIDTEFTGLCTATRENHNHVTDSPEVRYLKTRLVTSQCMVVELGICVVYRDKEKGSLVACPMNFTCYPGAKNDSFNGGDRRFMVQASCLRFLASCGFDFNKAFQDGIPWLRVDEEVNARKELERRLNKKRESISLGPAGERIKEFMDQVAKWKDGSEVSFTLPACDAFHRKLMYQEVERVYGSTFAITTEVVYAAEDTEKKEVAEKKEVVGKAIKVSRIPHGASKQAGNDVDERRVKMEHELAQAIGMRHVIDALSKANAPVVVHNGLLDLCYLYAQFHLPLPPSLQEFKDSINKLFPQIYDTKLLAEHESVFSLTNTSVLGKLRKATMKAPFVMPALETDDDFAYEGTDKLHEAGYDAYITACVFLALPAVLEKAVKETDSGASMDRAFANKVYMTRSPSYMDLGKAQEVADWSTAHHASFPEAWQTHDLKAQFAFAGGNVKIHWINDTAAVVTLPEGTTVEGHEFDSRLVLQPLSDYSLSQKRRLEGDTHMNEMTELHASKRRCV